jgi:ketosteroid isomerase-like protein
VIRVSTFMTSLLLAATCTASGSDDSQPPSAQGEVRDLEAQFEQAVVKGNVEFFEKTLAKDFTHTTQSGVIRNREEWLANHKSGQSNYESLNTDQLAIRVYGNTALVTARISPRGRDSRGKAIEGQYRFLRVWLRQEDVWRAVAFQSTRIAESEKGVAR